MAALGRGRREHQAQRGRCQQRRSRGLDDPEADQHRQAGSQTAGRRGQREDQRTEQKARVAAASLRQAAEDDQQRRVHDRVAVEHPRELAEVALVEVAADVRQRDVDDEQVDAGEDDAGADDHEDLCR